MLVITRGLCLISPSLCRLVFQEQEDARRRLHGSSTLSTELRGSDLIWPLVDGEWRISAKQRRFVVWKPDHCPFFKERAEPFSGLNRSVSQERRSCVARMCSHRTDDSKFFSAIQNGLTYHIWPARRKTWQGQILQYQHGTDEYWPRSLLPIHNPKQKFPELQAQLSALCLAQALAAHCHGLGCGWRDVCKWQINLGLFYYVIQSLSAVLYWPWQKFQEDVPHEYRVTLILLKSESDSLCAPDRAWICSQFRGKRLSIQPCWDLLAGPDLFWGDPRDGFSRLARTSENRGRKWTYVGGSSWFSLSFLLCLWSHDTHFLLVPLFRWSPHFCWVDFVIFPVFW